MADFQAHLGEFTDRGVSVIAASSESEEEAGETAKQLGLSLPVGYGLEPADFALQFGAFYSDDGTYLHATGFLLDPDGLVDISVYSCGAIGRLTASDALQILEYRLASND